MYTKYETNGEWVPLIKICNNSNPDARSVGTDLLKVEFTTNKFFNGSGFQAIVFGSKQKVLGKKTKKLLKL